MTLQQRLLQTTGDTVDVLMEYRRLLLRNNRYYDSDLTRRLADLASRLRRLKLDLPAAARDVAPSPRRSTPTGDFNSRSKGNETLQTH